MQIEVYQTGTKIEGNFSKIWKPESPNFSFKICIIITKKCKKQLFYYAQFQKMHKNHLKRWFLQLMNNVGDDRIFRDVAIRVF